MNFEIEKRIYRKTKYIIPDKFAIEMETFKTNEEQILKFAEVVDIGLKDDVKPVEESAATSRQILQSP